METRLLSAQSPGDLDEAASLLRAGGLAALPTETVYGLGGLALEPLAVRAIYAAKGRPATNPLIVHVLGEKEARPLCARWPLEARQLVARFWPGPLTLVLPRTEIVPDEVTAGGPTVAVRAPSHPAARALLERIGAPLAAPSANRAEHVSPTTAAHVLRDLNGRIDAVVDGGRCRFGIESSVLPAGDGPAQPPEAQPAAASATATCPATRALFSSRRRFACKERPCVFSTRRASRNGVTSLPGRCRSCASASAAEMAASISSRGSGEGGGTASSTPVARRKPSQCARSSFAMLAASSTRCSRAIPLPSV